MRKRNSRPVAEIVGDKEISDEVMKLLVDLTRQTGGTQPDTGGDPNKAPLPSDADEPGPSDGGPF